MDVERFTLFPHFFGISLAEEFQGVWAMVPGQARQTSTLFYYRFCLWPVYCSDLFHGSA